MNKEDILKSMTVQIDQQYVVSNGVLVNVISKTGKKQCTVEDSELNTAKVTNVALLSGKVEWKYNNPSLDRYTVDTSEKFRSKFHGFFRVISLDGSKVKIKWDETGNLSFVDLPDIAHGLCVDDGNIDPSLAEGYYVYAASVNETLMYIGRGHDSRYLHVNSGTSHNYNLNKLHFQGFKFTVKIIRDKLTYDESVEHELYSIRQMKPKFNIVHSTV